MKVKVVDIARKLEIKSRQVIETAKSMGIECKAANSSLTEEDAAKVEKKLLSSLNVETQPKKEDKDEKKKKENSILSKLPGKPLSKAESRKVSEGKIATGGKTETSEAEKKADEGEQKLSTVKKAAADKPAAEEISKSREATKEDRKSKEEKKVVKSTEKKADEESKEAGEEKQTAKENASDVKEPKKEEKKFESRLKIIKKAEPAETVKSEESLRSAKKQEEKAAAEADKAESSEAVKDSKDKSKREKRNEERKKKRKEEKLLVAKKKMGIIRDENAVRGPVIVKKASEIEEEERKKKLEAERKNAAKKRKESRKSEHDRDRNKSDRRGDSSHSQASEIEGAKHSRGRTRRVEFDTDAAMGIGEGKRSKKKDKQKSRDSFKDRSKKKNKLDYDSLIQYGEESLEKKSRKKYQKVKQREEEHEIEEVVVEAGTTVINVPITVAGFAEQVGLSVPTVIMALMKMGIVSNINANLDQDVVELLAAELELKIVIGNVESESEEDGIEDFRDAAEDLKPRPPIITVMGHVDHGKTSLLDAIRATNVIAQESGGITQHIGASEVVCNGQKIVFLDTPGHEAFTAMRARGADITDIAVLVVAADDSVKPQTVESISHAKAAGVPIIVAMNKMDKEGANPDMVKKDLSEHGILVEDWGGEVICVPVSAKKKEGIEHLLEMILLQSEVLELKANPDRKGLGTVIEARLDKAKGPVATLLVTNGTVNSGDSVVAGTTSGRIRLMTDFKGNKIKTATPATAVEILGLNEVPAAGDDFHIVENDKIAREISEKRKEKLRKEVLAKNSSTTLEELFTQIQSGEVKELNLIVKADVRGSVGAIISSLEQLSNDEVKVKIIHSGVGTVTESDISLASTSGAIIIGFNVRPSAAISSIADREEVQIRTYRVIYDIIDDIENAMKGMLDPEYEEVVLGQLEIREIFKVPGVGSIGGAYVTNGKVLRKADVRIVRDGIVIHEGKISSLKRFKDDVKEVMQGYECGVGIEDYNDIKEGDVVECFEMQEVKRD